MIGGDSAHSAPPTAPFHAKALFVETVCVQARVFSAEGVASFLRLSREQYVDVALLLGCDYTEHVNQVGRT